MYYVKQRQTKPLQNLRVKRKGNSEKLIHNFVCASLCFLFHLGNSNICLIKRICKSHLAYDEAWFCRYLAKVLVTEGLKDIPVNAPIAIMVSIVASSFSFAFWVYILKDLTNHKDLWCYFINIHLGKDDQYPMFVLFLLLNITVCHTEFSCHVPYMIFRVLVSILLRNF